MFVRNAQHFEAAGLDEASQRGRGEAACGHHGFVVGGEQRLVGGDVYEQRAAGSEDAVHFAECVGWIGDPLVVDHGHRDHRVERTRCERQRRHAAAHELREVALAGVRQCVRREVETDAAAGARQVGEVATGAAAGVEDRGVAPRG